MKRTNLLVLALALSFGSAYAQTEEQVLNSAPIDVDGYLQEKPVTDGELESIRSELNKQKMGTKLNKEKAKDLGKLTNQTEKLLESQDEYIDQKIESTQAIKEFNSKYEDNQKKLRCIMEELDTEECEPYKKQYRKEKKAEVEVEEPAAPAHIEPPVGVPAQTVMAEIAPAQNTGAAFEEIKLLPFAGATSYNGKVEQLESEIAAGLRLESNITPRFSMGIGFNYAGLKTKDFANNRGYMNNYYNSVYGQGREIQYKQMGFDFYGKFFLTQSVRFRPYLGAGLGYNRASLKYNDNQQGYDYTTPYGYSYGSENYNTSYMSGNLMLGSEILVTESFGINLEAQYSTGLGDSMSSKSAKNGGTSPDQRRLRDLGDEIINSNALSIFAGAVVKF